MSNRRKESHCPQWSKKWLCAKKIDCKHIIPFAREIGINRSSALRIIIHDDLPVCTKCDDHKNFS